MRTVKYALPTFLALASFALAHATAAMSRDQALAVFKNATGLFAKVCTAGENDKPPPLPDSLEGDTGNALTVADGILSKRDDPELLNALLGYIGASDCSADESRAFTLGSIFHHRPDALQAAIAALPEKSRCELVGQLDWGWQNEIYGETPDPKVKADREARLKKLKSTLPKSCSANEG